ncbi:MAG: hypothetical protein IPN95_31570, partial [Bacteroidetes bacterium]|nr:hypothetical protein [Bacteroidota bacterium]
MPAEVEIPNIPCADIRCLALSCCLPDWRPLWSDCCCLISGVVFMGVLPVIWNVFGLVRASYAHDGFHVIGQENGLLWIQRGDMRAAVKRVSEKRLHKGDWHVLRETVAAARPSARKVQIAAPTDLPQRICLICRTMPCIPSIVHFAIPLVAVTTLCAPRMRRKQTVFKSPVLLSRRRTVFCIVAIFTGDFESSNIQA